MITRRTLLRRIAGATAVASAPVPALVPCRASAAEPLVLWTSEHERTRLHVMDYIAKAYGAWAGVPPPRVESVTEDRIVDVFSRARHEDRAPDLINTGGDLLLAMDAASPFDRDLAASLISEIGDFFEGARLALTTPDGQQAAIPFHGWPQVLWFRQDLFADARVPPPGNLRSLLNAAESLHQGQEKRIGVVCGTDDGIYTQQIFAQLARAEGISLFSTGGMPMLDHPAVHRVLAAYAAMAAFGPPGTTNWRARDWYLQGRAAMMFYSTFIMDDLAIAEIAENSLRGGRFPGLGGAPFDDDLVRNTRHVTAFAPTGATFSAINGIAARPGLDDGRRAAVADFLRFLFRPDTYVVWLHMAPGGMMPVRRDVAGTDGFLRDPIGVFQRFGRDQVIQLADSLIHPGTFAHWQGVTVPNAATVHADGLVGRMVARVVAGDATPVESARTAQKEAETLLRR